MMMIAVEQVLQRVYNSEVSHIENDFQTAYSSFYISMGTRGLKKRKRVK